MMILLLLFTALLSTVTSDWWYPTPSPYTNDNIMSGNFKYKRVPGDAKVWEEYMKVWGVKMPEENQIDDQGYGTSFNLLSDGSGVDVDYEGQWTLPLRFGQEITSTEPALGKEMKSLSWRTGHNTFYVKNVVEEDGIKEVKNLVFYPHGAQVFSTVTKPAEDLKATLYEWLERVDDEGKATTFYI